MAQKICPKCSHGMGPRSKSCPKCGYVYPHLQNGSSDNDDDDDDESEIKTRVERKPCIQCGSILESYKTHIDSYGRVSYWYKDDDYCGRNCMLTAIGIKNDLILVLLNKIKDYNNNDQLNPFTTPSAKHEDETNDSGEWPPPKISNKRFNFLFEESIQEAENNERAYQEELEYCKTHNRVPPKRKIEAYSLTDARNNALMRGDFTLVRIINEKLGESKGNSADANSSIEENEKLGIRIPPKIGSYVPKEPEIEMNPLKAALRGIKLPSPMVEDESGEEVEDLTNDGDESDDEDSSSESQTILKDVSPSKPLTIAEKFAQFKTKTIAPTTVSAPVSNQPQSSIPYDSVSVNTRGQKKCGAAERAKGIKVGCGKILGVRVKECPTCGYKFP